MSSAIPLGTYAKFTPKQKATTLAILHVPSPTLANWPCHHSQLQDVWCLYSHMLQVIVVLGDIRKIKTVRYCHKIHWYHVIVIVTKVFEGLKCLRVNFQDQTKILEIHKIFILENYRLYKLVQFNSFKTCSNNNRSVVVHAII